MAGLREQQRQKSSGFTMVELLCVITVLGILSMLALAKFLDFRRDARISTAKYFMNSMQSAIKIKSSQMALSCGSLPNSHPRLAAILQNDITEGGAAGADCTVAQIPNPTSRKLIDTMTTINPPVNPYNDLATVAACTCTNPCDAACNNVAGYCYNQQIGMMWAQGLVDGCSGSTTTITSAATSSSPTSATSSASAASQDPCAATDTDCFSGGGLAVSRQPRQYIMCSGACTEIEDCPSGAYAGAVHSIGNSTMNLCNLPTSSSSSSASSGG